MKRKGFFMSRDKFGMRVKVGVNFKIIFYDS